MTVGEKIKLKYKDEFERIKEALKETYKIEKEKIIIEEE